MIIIFWIGINPTAVNYQNCYPVSIYIKFTNGISNRKEGAEAWLPVSMELPTDTELPCLSSQLLNLLPDWTCVLLQFRLRAPGSFNGNCILNPSNSDSLLRHIYDNYRSHGRDCCIAIRMPPKKNKFQQLKILLPLHTLRLKCHGRIKTLRIV